MRASATSRISHQTSLQASQAATHALKAGDVSPFALMMHAAARKDSRGEDDKTDDAQKNAAKPDDKGRTNPQTRDKSQPAPAQTTTQPRGKGETTDSRDSDKTASADKDKAGKSGDTQAPADGGTQPQPQPQPATADAAQVLPQLAAAQAAMAQASNLQANAAPANDQDADEAAPVSATASGKGQSPTAATPAAQIPPGRTVAGQTGQDSAAQAAAQSPAAGTSKTPGASGIRPAAANGKAGDATDKSAKTDSRASGNAGDAKVDSADDAKPAAQPAAATAADSPKSQAPSPNLTVAGLTPAPTQQAATPAAAQALTQHVQVTAQPATNLPQPNLPALGVEIAARSQSGARQFDIRLDPPELGRVEVRLSIDSTGKASAHLSADQPQTLDLLQKDASGLTRALRDAGLNVAQEGLNFSLRQQAGNSQDHGGGRTLSRRGGALSLHAGKSIEATATSAVWRARPDGRLDISV